MNSALSTSASSLRHVPIDSGFRGNDGRGSNLSNDVAHGLLDDQESQGYWAVYAWWLVLKLVFGGYRDALIASRQAADLEAGSANADDAPSSDGK